MMSWYERLYFLLGHGIQIRYFGSEINAALWLFIFGCFPVAKIVIKFWVQVFGFYFK